MEEKTNPTSQDILTKQETPAKAVENKSPETSVPTEESPQEKNWRQFRETRAKERKEKEEAERDAAKSKKEAEALKAALEAILPKSPLASTTNGSDNHEEEDEISKRVREEVAKVSQEQERKRNERDRAEEPEKLKRTFPDFDQVCSQSNVDYLEYHHPEAFEALKSMPDSFDKWTKVYNAMKRYIPNNNAVKDSAKAEKNLKKPQSMSSALTATGDSQPVMSMNDQRKADNWARMQRVMKGIE